MITKSIFEYIILLINYIIGDIEFDFLEYYLADSNNDNYTKQKRQKQRKAAKQDKDNEEDDEDDDGGNKKRQRQTQIHTEVTMAVIQQA